MGGGEQQISHCSMRPIRVGTELAILIAASYPFVAASSFGPSLSSIAAACALT